MVDKKYTTCLQMQWSVSIENVHIQAKYKNLKIVYKYSTWVNVLSDTHSLIIMLFVIKNCTICNVNIALGSIAIPIFLLQPEPKKHKY